MLIYFLIFLIGAIIASSAQVKYDTFQKKNGIWNILIIFYSLLIGFRDHVGGDWNNYLKHFELISYYSITEILNRSDPGYYIINWLMKDWGFEIYSVNLICAVLFMIGLVSFAKRQPNPWLAIAVAFPYLIVVVAMGYTRQAVALGFVFWGLAALADKKFIKFLILVSLGATFHKSAVLMIGLGIFLQGHGKFIRLIAVLFVGIGIWSAFLAEYQDALWQNYVEVQMESQGAYIRVAMNLVPAVIFLFFRKHWKQQFQDYSFWFIIAVGSILAVALVPFASTAVDRIALYFTPIQVVVYSRLPYLLRNMIAPQTTTFLILAYYFAVLYVWLNYATHAQYWIPYQNALFEGVF